MSLKQGHWAKRLDADHCFALDQSLAAAGLRAELLECCLAALLSSDHSDGNEAHAVALMDNLINGFVRERAGTAALRLQLDVVLCFDLLPGLGLCLSLSLHPRGEVTAGLPFGFVARDMLRCLVHPCLQLVEPRCPVLLRGFILRARPWLRPGSGRHVQTRDALWRPGGSRVTGGLLVAGIGAIGGLGISLKLLPP